MAKLGAALFGEVCLNSAHMIQRGLTWFRQGKRVNDKEVKIPGGLKYSWVEGESRAPPKPKVLQ